MEPKQVWLESTLLSCSAHVFLSIVGFLTFRILPRARGGTLFWLRRGSSGSVSALFSPWMWEITSSASLIFSKHTQVSDGACEVMLAKQQEKASHLTFTADGVIRDCSTEATGQRNG